MYLIVICLVAFVTSILTFFSGFGLGTILAPVMMLFFPVDVSIVMTGIVHLANNLFKLFLVGRSSDRQIVLRFGIPAVMAAFAGAWVLQHLKQLPVLAQYSIGQRICEVTVIKLVIAGLLIAFALMDVLPKLKKLQFDKNKMVLGGVLSGFFGGLSGHQGALRSCFLVRCGLSKESLVATGVVIAVLVDLARIGVYFSPPASLEIREHVGLIVAASLSAIAGALIGNSLLKKVTLTLVQMIVTVSVVLIAVALAIGLI